MRRVHSMITVAIGVLALAACQSNPPLGPDEEVGDDGHEISVELTLSASHVHTLSPITFTVAVTDEHGAPVTDFEILKVERLAVGTETWRGTELTLNGTVYEAEYTFASSGEYMLRVVGKRSHDVEEVVLHEMHDPIAAARAHAEAGGLRVEFESFPGHLHEGDIATMKFWILEPERNDAGERPPIEGLEATIVCHEADGAVEQHLAMEESAGVYVAEHEFLAVGDFVAEIRYTGTDGHEAIAEFTTHVAHGH